AGQPHIANIAVAAAQQVLVFAPGQPLADRDRRRSCSVGHGGASLCPEPSPTAVAHSVTRGKRCITGSTERPTLVQLPELVERPGRLPRSRAIFYTGHRVYWAA